MGNEVYDIKFKNLVNGFDVVVIFICDGKLDL